MSPRMYTGAFVSTPTVLVVCGGVIPVGIAEVVGELVLAERAELKASLSSMSTIDRSKAYSHARNLTTNRLS